MIHLRCTSKLLRRLRVSPQVGAMAPDGRLGDWTAHVFALARVPIVLCVNDRTRLPVLLPLKESRTLVRRFRLAAARAIHRLAPESAVLYEELAALEEITVAWTANRSVLGTINEFVKDCQYWRYPHRATVADLLELEAHLSGTLCGPLDYRTPVEVAREALRERP